MTRVYGNADITYYLSHVFNSRHYPLPSRTSYAVEIFNCCLNEMTKNEMFEFFSDLLSEPVFAGQVVPGP